MWLTLLARFWYVPVILALILLTAYYRNSAEKTQLKFDAFVSETKALGEQAKLHKVEKEAQDAKQIADAVSGRDAALKRLRDAQADARSRSLPSSPVAPAGSRQVCFGSEAYNAAFKRFGERYGAGLQGIIGIAVEGDAAAIDAKTLIDAWPTAKPSNPAP